jgi:hypothetical protein
VGAWSPKARRGRQWAPHEEEPLRPAADVRFEGLRPEKFRDNYDPRKTVVDDGIDEEIRELAQQLRIRDPTREDVLTAAQAVEQDLEDVH